ncbi:MAG: SPOR domain-containing protein [Nitrospirae bacterium]|nr:SPOR domain-containing protein [Nitrospirota bacterium]
MKNDGTPSMLKKAFLFLVTLLLLMVVSFFIGVYLGADNIKEQPSVPATVAPITPPADKRLAASDKPAAETRRLATTETRQLPVESTPKPVAPEAKPVAPEAKPVAPEAKPVPPEPNKTAPEVAHPAPAPQKPAPEAKKAVPANDHKQGGAYYVQVGAFKNLREAERTVEKLRKKGFDAYMIEPASADKTPMFKVRVGKYAKKPDADAVAEKLRKNEAVQAFVESR